MSNHIYFLVGPSGVGKTTARKHITNKYANIKFIPSFTTRPPRVNEIDGIDYFYIDRNRFQELIKTNSFLEWEEHFGNFYGITKGYCEEQLKNGYSLIKEIALGGYEQILNSSTIDKNLFKSIFIYPDNISDLVKRIEKRGEQNVEKRRVSIEEELENSRKCDHIVISKHNDLPALFTEIESIINQG